jgi:hypothetical protein
MKIGSSLALICIGAILAFAVTANTSFFNMHTAGWVLMVIGVIGLLLPGRTAGWLGRRLLVRRGYPTTRVERTPVRSYVTPSSGVATVQRGLPARPTLLAQEDDLIEDPRVGTTEVVEDVYEEPATEVVEDIYEEP